MLLRFEYVDQWLLIITFQMLYPSINLDEINEAHSRGLELVKEEIFQQLEITKLDTVGLVIIRSPRAVSEIAEVLYRCKLSYRRTYSRYPSSVIANNYCLPRHA